MKLNETLWAVINRKTNTIRKICITEGMAMYLAEHITEKVIPVRIIPVKGAKKR